MFLNVKCKGIKLLEGSTGENLNDTGYGGVFLDTTLKTRTMRKITDQLDFIKIKNPRSVKDIIERTRRQATGTSLAVQWLRLCTSTAGARVHSLVRELRSCMPLTAKKKEEEEYKPQNGRKCLQKRHLIKEYYSKYTKIS